MPPREGVRAADEGAGRTAVAEPARRPRLSPALPRAVLRQRNAGASTLSAVECRTLRGNNPVENLNGPVA
jgi:hypothetical protein